VGKQAFTQAFAKIDQALTKLSPNFEAIEKAHPSFCQEEAQKVLVNVNKKLIKVKV